MKSGRGGNLAKREGNKRMGVDWLIDSSIESFGFEFSGVFPVFGIHVHSLIVERRKGVEIRRKERKKKKEKEEIKKKKKKKGKRKQTKKRKKKTKTKP